MKSFRQTMLAICVILIASAFAGCGAHTDLPDKRPALGKDRVHKPERQRIEGAFARAAL